MSVQIAIVCTTCGCTGEADEGASREPAHALRAKLKGRGWAVGCYSMKDRSSTGSYDFCPPCIQNYMRVERARRSVSGADADCTEAVLKEQPVRNRSRYEPDRAKRCNDVNRTPGTELIAVCNRTKDHPDEHERWSHTGIRIDVWLRPETALPEEKKT